MFHRDLFYLVSARFEVGGTVNISQFFHQPENEKQTVLIAKIIVKLKIK
jgi:hypothetical protein